MSEIIDLFRYSEAGLKLYKKIRTTLYQDSKCIFLAAMPKSGSSFLSRALCELTGYQHSYLAFDYSNIEQELYRPRVIDAYGRGTVVQQHVRANDPNIRIFNEFRIRPIVLVRNIFDVVISVRDHLRTEKIDNLPSIYTSKEFLSRTADEQADFIVDFVVPWYIAYYTSWIDAERHRQIPFMWLVYEEIRADWTDALLRTAAFCHIDVSEQQAAETVRSLQETRSSNIRFNQGVSGRGEASLSEWQKDKIVALTAHYPWVDFSRIGIA